MSGMKFGKLLTGWLGLAAALSVMLWAFTSTSRSSFPTQAELHYEEGVGAKSVAERKRAFNLALKEFLHLEENGDLAYGSGRLYYDIGNTYFQIEEYPRAILYYLRAERLMPKSEVVRRNLAIARKKLSLSSGSADSGWLRRFLFEPWLPLPRRLQLFSFLAVAATLLVSLSLWLRSRWLARSALFCVVFLGITAVNLAATYYFTPVEAVVVTPAFLRKDGGTAYAKVADQPLPAGSVVEAIEITGDRKWVKVAAAGGVFGFLPVDAIQVVR